MEFLSDFYAASAVSALIDLSDRIDYISQYFLGKPYIADPQGEGIDGEIDQAPLFRFDGFDCVTYVNTVLALSLSQNADTFQSNLLKINYYDSIPRFENRFHFMSLDWNPQNQKNNILRDITDNIFDENQKPIAMMAEGEIDKPNWFLKKADSETAERAAKLQCYAAQFKKEFARIPYLPLTQLFDAAKNPVEFIFNQLPRVSVIEIVRPNWNLVDKIGTNLHVSHIGFAIRKNNQLYFRHASSEKKCVVEILLFDYLKNYLNSQTIKGINVQSCFK